MKIAIQGHPTRGKEIIQILESLSGKNKEGLNGSKEYWYFINSDGYIRNDYKSVLQYKGFKTYTLEEFEKEFPYKIGDKVTTTGTNHPKIITGITDTQWGLRYVISEIKFPDSKEMPHISQISLYKEMKEERNITLTLDKAKEWYKKGGELKEIALQVFSERELNLLPKSWEEFCRNNPVQVGECWLENCDEICKKELSTNEARMYKNWIPSRKSAEAHLAMIQLEQLRNCWWNDWKPIWGISQKWCIRLFNGVPSVGITTNISKFLTFPTREMAEEFLECFKDLIEKAKDLI